MSGERKAAVIGDVEYSKKRVKQEYEEAIRQLRLQANMDALLKAVNKFGVFEDSNEPAKELLDRLTNGEADDGLFSFVGSRIRRNSNFVMRDPKRYEPVNCNFEFHLFLQPRFFFEGFELVVNFSTYLSCYSRLTFEPGSDSVITSS